MINRCPNRLGMLAQSPTLLADDTLAGEGSYIDINTGVVDAMDASPITYLLREWQAHPTAITIQRPLTDNCF